MGSRYFIGIDDTDYGDSIGTGALSRELTALLVRDLDATPHGVTRHQLLVHPEIPYTSHNSAACVEIEADSTLEETTAKCRELINFLFHPGADPGLCVATPGSLGKQALAFGRRAQSEIVTKDEATDIGHRSGVLLEEHGGTGLGVIGALSACALRMHGDDGRFIAHHGIRDVPGCLSAAKIKAVTAVQAVVDQEGVAVPDGAMVHTRNWIRPDLKQGRVVLTVSARPGAQEFEIVKAKKADDM